MTGKKPSYVWAFLTHPLNRMLMLGATAAAVLASFPYGWDGMALMMLGLAAVEIAGMAIVPGLPPFRAAVDHEVSRAERAARRQLLLEEIASHGGSEHLSSYEAMCVSIATLYRVASESHTALTERDVDVLDNLTIQYLGMCLSETIMKAGRSREWLSSVKGRLQAVEEQLEKEGLDPDNVAQLRRAKAEYEEALARHSRMSARRSALEASLMSMPVRIKEIYQMVMTAPQAGNLSELLEQSVSRLRVREELDMEADDVLKWVRMTESAPVAASAAPDRTRPRRGVEARH